MSRFALVAACLLFVNASFANAAVIYDFDVASGYSATDTTINGQNGWTGSTNTILTSISGERLLRVGGNQLASHGLSPSDVGDLTTVSYRTFVTNNTSSYGEMQLFDSNNTVYARVGLQNATDHFYVVSAGNSVLNFDTNAVAGGEYYDVTVTVDFAAQQYRATYFYVNGATQHADTGFVNFINPTTTALAANGTISLQGGSASSRFSYFDNVSISSVPEPYSIVLVATGIVGVGLVAARRRRK